MIDKKPPFWNRLPKGHPLTEGLILFMPLAKGFGSEIRDYSNYKNHGSLYDSLSWASGGSGYLLEGHLDNDDCILVPHSSSLVGMAGLTLCIWAKNNKSSIGATGTEFLFSKTGADEDCYSFYWDSSEDIRFYIYDAGLGDVLCSQTNGLEDDNWHFWTARYDGSEMSIWKDGVKMGTTANQTGTINPAVHDLRIGGSSGAAWDGLFDLPMIYNRALSAEEIQRLYNEPFWYKRKTKIPLISYVGGGVVYDETGLTVSANAAASISDAVTALEAGLDVSAEGNSSITDIQSMTDTVTVSADGQASAPNIQSMIETLLTVTAEGTGSVSESLTNSETGLTVSADGTVNLTDTAGFTDSLTVQADGVALISDIQQMTESLTVSANSQAQVSDAMICSEGLTVTADSQASITDLQQSTDTLTVHADCLADVNDTAIDRELLLTVQADGVVDETDFKGFLEQVTAQATAQASLVDYHSMAETLNVQANAIGSLINVQTMIETLSVSASAIADQNDTYIPVGGFVAAPIFMILKKHR